MKRTPARMTISLPWDLKDRMDNYEGRIVWSQAAAKAFREAMDSEDLRRPIATGNEFVGSIIAGVGFHSEETLS